MNSNRRRINKKKSEEYKISSLTAKVMRVNDIKVVAADIKLYFTADPANQSEEIRKLNDVVISDDAISFKLKDNADKTIIELAKTFINSVSNKGEIEEENVKSIISVIGSILQTANDYHFSEKPRNEFLYSNLLAYMMTKYRNIIPPYLISFALPKTAEEKSAAMSFNDTKIAQAIMNDKMSLDDEVYENIMTNQLDLMTVIYLFNERFADDRITRCSLPLVEAMLGYKKRKVFEKNLINKTEKDANAVIRFFCTLEGTSCDSLIITFNEDTALAAIKKLIPVENKEILTAEMFGLGNLNSKTGVSTPKHNEIANAKINKEGIWRHNLVIFETVVLAAFITDDVNNDIYHNLVKIIASFAFAGMTDEALDYTESEKYLVHKICLPTLVRILAYDAESLYVDSLSGTQNLSLNASYPSYGYQDIYGLTYGVSTELFAELLDEHGDVSKKDFSVYKYASHKFNTTVSADSELARIAWNNHENLDGFAKILLQNNLDAALSTDDELFNKVLLKIIYGYSRIGFANACLPEIIYKAFYTDGVSIEFRDIIHVMLRHNIGLPVHLTMREYRIEKGFTDKVELMNLRSDSNKESNVVPASKNGFRCFKLVASREKYEYTEIGSL